jgi:hypothetical protein
MRRSIAALALLAIAPALAVAQDARAKPAPRFRRITFEQTSRKEHDYDRRLVVGSDSIARWRFLTGREPPPVDVTFYMSALADAVSRLDPRRAIDPHHLPREPRELEKITVEQDDGVRVFEWSYDAKKERGTWDDSAAPLARILQSIEDDVWGHTQRELFEGTVRLPSAPDQFGRWNVRIESADGKLSDPVDVDPTLFRPLDGRHAAIEVKRSTWGVNPDDPGPTVFFEGLRAKATRDFTVDVVPPDERGDPLPLAVHEGEWVNVQAGFRDKKTGEMEYVVVPVAFHGKAIWHAIPASAISFGDAATPGVVGGLAPR